MTLFSEKDPDKYYMNKALAEARHAFEEDEVPVGAIVVCNNQIIGKGYNQVEKLNDVTAHAEMLAITAASAYLGSKYLQKCKIYISLEPCVMCAAAISAAQFSEVIYAAKDPKKGYSLFKPGILHPKTIVKTGVLSEESESLLKEFFRKKRKDETN